MSKKIENTLFRFATLRAPQMIDSEGSSLSFVKHQNLSASTFMSAVEGLPEADKRRVALADRAKSYAETSFATKADVKKAVGTTFYDFAKWFISNRATLKVDEVTLQMENVTALEKTVSDQVWDNLFYQIISYKSGEVREMLFSILTADFFITKVKDVEKSDEAYRKLAQARIVIPNDLFELETIFGTSGSAQTINTKALDKELNTIVLNDKVKYLSNIKKDVQKLKKGYDDEQSDAYSKAFDAYQRSLKDLSNAAQSKTQEYTDKELGVVKSFVSYDPVDAPDFTFEPAPQLDAKILVRASEETQGFVNAIVDEQGYTTFDELIQHIDDEINTNTEALFEEAPLEDTLVNYNGTLVPVSTDIPTGATFSISGSQMTPTTVLFNTDFSNAVVLSADYQITFVNGGQTFSGTSFSDSIANNKLSLRIFTGGEVDFSGKGSFNITGTFNLNDDRQITVSGFARVLSAFPPRSGGGYHIFGNGSYTVKRTVDNGTGTVTTIDYIPAGYGIKRLGIADYRRVDQTICCYVPGEVSHIENIMAREFKEKETRRLRRREDTTLLSTEKETENLTDTTTTDRFEMNQEVSSVIQQDREFSANTEFSAEWGTGGPKFGLTAGADFSTATSTEESNSQAVTFAKEVTERALDRVVQKVKEERTIKVIEEFEEKNVHGFDNRAGDNHISGVYRWVDKIYKNQVINYGKRLMYEFMIPEPAAFHNIAIKGEAPSSDEVLVKPKDPRTATGVLNLKDYTKINETTYAHWAGLYNAEVNAPPKQNIVVGESFNINVTGGAKLAHTESNSGNGKIRIPEGYKATHASGIFNASSDYDTQGNILSLVIGNRNVRYTNRFHHHTLYLNDPLWGDGFVGEVPVSYTLGNHVAGDITAVVYCTLTSEAEKQWKIETFNAIIKAYENKLAEYESKANGIIEDFGVNPGFFRQIENNVLRKNCIEYLAGHDQIGSNFILNRDDVQSVRADYENDALETYAARVKFFEQAFEWNIMSYNFYPFYWADKSKWKSLYNVTEFNDPLHRSFLQSGMGRVIVTVRPGFEEAVNWYMATGQIWNGGQVPTMDDELFLSIVEELQEPEGAVEETWESRVPTSLTVIQAGAIGLNVEGLPCNEECNDFRLFDSDGNEILDADGNSFTNPIQQTDAQIGEASSATAG